MYRNTQGGEGSTFFGSRRQSRVEDRPHTVHASAHCFGQEVSPERDFDIMPRPSVYTASTLRSSNPFRRPSEILLRDDTAADMTFFPQDPISLPSRLENIPPVTAQDKFNALQQEQTAQYLRTRPSHRRRNPFKSFGSSSTAQFSTSSSQDTIISQTQSQPRETATLGRTFSRRLRSQVKSFGESMQTGFIPSAGRSRRSSTPHDIGIDPSLSTIYPPPPASPSKRNGKHADDRPRKIRPNILNFGDRKDTPAPAVSAAAGVAVRRPMSRSQPLPASVVISGGGEGARAAARGYNSHQTVPQMPLSLRFNESSLDLDSDENIEIQARNASNRARLGSLSSAADSGADLSTFSGSDRCDQKEMEFEYIMGMEMDMEDFGAKGRDFTAKLPDEINLQIFELLDAQDLCNAGLMSKRWKVLSQETSVWRAAYMRKFARTVHTDPAPIQVGGVGVGRPNKPDQDWRKMYEARLTIEANWRKGKDAGKATYLSGHTDSVYCLQFDEEKIITGSRDRTIRVWDINTFQCLKVIGGPNVRPVMGPKVLRTVDYPSFHMATASVNGTNYGNQIYHVPREWHDASILCLQYDEEILVTGSSDSDLLVWNIKTFEPIKRLRKHSGGVLDVALDAKHIVSCSKDSKIIVWDRKTLEPKGVLAGHRGPVNAVQLRGHLLVSASGDGIARLWDLNTMKLTKEFSAKERGLAAVEFSEDMKYVLAGGNDHITYKFETETGREVQQFVGHTQLVRSLWLDSANRRVVSGSYDLDLRVYDFDTGAEIWRAEEWTTSWMLAAKSDYRRIVATSQDGRILIVDFGLKRGGREDGTPIDNAALLRGIEHTSEIEWRNPFAKP